MKPRRGQSTLGSLDSLLDTMTNVVGILVIILVVTILGVQEAVNRISAELEEKDLVSEVQYNAALDEAKTVSAELAKLKALPTSEDDLDDQRKQLTAVNQEIKQLAAKFGDAPEATADPAKLAKTLAESDAKLATANKQADALRDQAERLEKQIDSTPVPVPEKPKLVTIPNPRPAPKDATPIYFFCKGGMVYELPLEALQELAQRRIENVTRSLRKDKPPCKAIIEYFQSRTVEVRDIRITARLHRDRIVLKFIPADDIGESPDQITRKSSRFRVSALRAARDGDKYARFLVWPDSYDVYLAARAITDEAGMPAGWQPNYASYVFQKWTSLTCVPDKPLPPVKKPPPTDPDAPKKPAPLPEPPID